MESNILGISSLSFFWVGSSTNLNPFLHHSISFFFTLLSAAVSLTTHMAATLTLLKLSILPNKPILPRQTTSKLVPSIFSKLNIPKDSPNPQKLPFLNQNIDSLKPATFLSLTAITFPFLLETKASNVVGVYFVMVMMIMSVVWFS